MIFRRWDPGIIAGYWFDTDVQGNNSDGWKRGFKSDQLGIVFGINKVILGRIRKLKIWFEWRLIPITIKAESQLYEGCLSGYASFIFIVLLPEIDRINQRFGFNGRWSFWYLWKLRLKYINIHQSEFIGDDFLRKDMDIWDKYNRRMGLSLRSIIFIRLASFFSIRVQRLFLIIGIMTQSHLLSHGEEVKNGEGTRKRLKISVVHFDNSALIKTYSKTLIGRCMNPEEQEMKCSQTSRRFGKWRKRLRVLIWDLASSSLTSRRRRILKRY